MQPHGWPIIACQSAALSHNKVAQRPTIMMRAAAMLLLLAGATTAQTACVFCPHDVTLDDEIDFENICAETSMPANCVAGWVINSDADATARPR